MITDKLEEDISSSMTNSTAASRPRVTLWLAVPARQCGSPIGKGGCKIKEIGESTGAQVQVAGDMLPNSTERAITIAGIHNPSLSVSNRSAWSCWRLSQSPEGRDYPVPAQALQFSSYLCRWSGLYHSRTVCHSTARFDQAAPASNATVSFPMTHGNTRFSGFESSSPEVKGYWAGLDASAQTTSHELTIPNDLIGCIIRRQGAKINEIRQMSGRRSKLQTQWKDRQVTITGSAASISLAQYLINVRLSLETGGMGSS